MIRPQSIRGMGREADQRVRLGVGLCLQVHLELRPAVYKQGALLANLQVMCRTRSAQGRTTAVTQPPPQPYHSRHLNFSTAATSTLPQPSPQPFHSRHLNNTTAATSTLTHLQTLIEEAVFADHRAHRHALSLAWGHRVQVRKALNVGYQSCARRSLLQIMALHVFGK
jgi:hypothetical protein